MDPPTDCSGVDGPYSLYGRNPTGTSSSPLHRSQPQGASHSLLAKSWTASEPTLGQCGSGQSPEQRARVAQDPAGHLLIYTIKTDPANYSGLFAADSHQRLRGPGSGKQKPTPGRSRLVPAVGNASTLLGVAWSVSVLSTTSRTPNGAGASGAILAPGPEYVCYPLPARTSLRTLRISSSVPPRRVDYCSRPGDLQQSIALYDPQDASAGSIPSSRHRTPKWTGLS